MITTERLREELERTLPVRVVAPPTRIQRGYGNESWRVETDDGPLLIKVARPHLDPEKLRQSARAHRAAVAGGVPVPELLLVDPECAALDGRPVRVQRYVAGAHPSEVMITDEAVQRFFGSLGRTVAALHTVVADGFASRFGGRPSFATWGEYVAYRVPQIVGRVEAIGGLPGLDHGPLFARVLALAADVSPYVEPRLTHRDLYLDNILAGPDGTVAALIDFDIAEAWDPVADLVKLRWQVWPGLPQAAQESFLDAYADPLPERFEDRIWIAEVLELVNVVANGLASGGNPEFTGSARQRLDRVLAAA